MPGIVVKVTPWEEHVNSAESGQSDSAQQSRSSPAWFVLGTADPGDCGSGLTDLSAQDVPVPAPHLSRAAFVYSSQSTAPISSTLSLDTPGAAVCLALADTTRVTNDHGAGASRSPDAQSVLLVHTPERADHKRAYLARSRFQKAARKVATGAALASHLSKAATAAHAAPHSPSHGQPAGVHPPWYILLPSSTPRKMWNAYMSAVLLFVLLYVPLRMGVLSPLDFSSKRLGAWEIFEVLTSVTFLLDMVVNFVSAYRHPRTKLCIYDARTIALHYLKTWFVIDLLASFPFYLFLQNSSLIAGKLARLPRLMRLVRTLRLFTILKEHQQTLTMRKRRRIHPATFKLVLIAVYVLVAVHFTACTYVWVGRTAGSANCHSGLDESALSSCGWVYYLGYQGTSHLSQYLAAVYWAIQTLATVGYGDLSGRTTEEHALSIAVMIVGVGWYAYIIGAVSSTMGQYQAEAQEVTQKLQAMEAFLSDSECPPLLASRIRQHYAYIYDKAHPHAVSQQAASQVVSELPVQLQSEVVCFLRRDVIIRIPWLAKIHNKSFIATLVNSLNFLRTLEDDEIIRQGMVATDLFFLTEGRVQRWRNGRGLDVLEAGAMIGEMGCLKTGRYVTTCTALSTCELQSLSMKDLHALRKEHHYIFDDLRKEASKKFKQLQELDQLESARWESQRPPSAGYGGEPPNFLQHQPSNASMDDFSTAPRHRHGSTQQSARMSFRMGELDAEAPSFASALAGVVDQLDRLSKVTLDNQRILQELMTGVDTSSTRGALL